MWNLECAARVKRTRTRAVVSATRIRDGRRRRTVCIRSRLVSQTDAEEFRDWTERFHSRFTESVNHKNKRVTLYTHGLPQRAAGSRLPTHITSHEAAHRGAPDPSLTLYGFTVSDLTRHSQLGTET